MKTNKEGVFAAVITAAGKSRRMKTSIKKEYLPLPGRETGVTVLSEALFKFLQSNLFSIIVITVPKTGIQKAAETVFFDTRIKKALQGSGTDLVFVHGGKERRASVFNALLKLEELSKKKAVTVNYVLVHDGARPFVSVNLIKAVCSGVKKRGAVIPGFGAVDTQKIAEPSGKIVTHLKRSAVYAVQTPQAFRFKELVEAHKKAALAKKVYTDDSEIYSEFIAPVFICEGEIENKKITFQGDL